MSLDIDRLAGAISAGRKAYRLPVRAEAEAADIVNAALALLFPHFAPDPRSDEAAVRGEINRLEASLTCFLAGFGPDAYRLDRPFSEGFPPSGRPSSWTPRLPVPPTRRPPASTR